MFKKLVLATLLAFSVSSMAAEKITIIWGFSPAANQANFYRAMVADLNRSQGRYEFVFDTRVGAGGAVAARYILDNPKNTLLGGTSTFFIRPNFDKETGYAAESFQPVLVQTLGAPVALYSTRFKTIDELKKSTEITNGISGYGSHSNLMASVLGEHYTGVRIINYVSLIDANKDVLGRHINTAWNWVSELEGSVDANLTNILGITGTRSVRGFPTLASQGIRGFERSPNWLVLLANAGADPAIISKIQTALTESFVNSQDQERYQRAGVDLNRQPTTNVREFLVEEVEKARLMQARLQK
jgi:tripartite-type tricarboxylate transporter receptor subunit TctC